jgi:hypothetical protein
MPSVAAPGGSQPQSALRSFCLCFPRSPRPHVRPGAGTRSRRQPPSEFPRPEDCGLLHRFITAVHRFITEGRTNITIFGSALLARVRWNQRYSRRRPRVVANMQTATTQNDHQTAALKGATRLAIHLLEEFPTPDWPIRYLRRSASALRPHVFAPLRPIGGCELNGAWSGVTVRAR